MKYMLMMHAPKEGWTTAGIGTWPPQAIKAHIDFMIGLNGKLKASGEFVDAQGLAGPEEAKSVRARKDGTPDTDGPFAEAKEFLAGFWIIDVDSARTRLRDRRAGLGGPGQGRRAAQHADRSAPGHERPAHRHVTTWLACLPWHPGIEPLLRELAPQRARCRRAALRRLQRRRGRRAGGAARGGPAVAARRHARESARAG